VFARPFLFALRAKWTSMRQHHEQDEKERGGQRRDQSERVGDARGAARRRPAQARRRPASVMLAHIRADGLGPVRKLGQRRDQVGVARRRSGGWHPARNT
jgi:hypothetical protein